MVLLGTERLLDRDGLHRIVCALLSGALFVVFLDGILAGSEGVGAVLLLGVGRVVVVVVVGGVVIVVVGSVSLVVAKAMVLVGPAEVLGGVLARGIDLLVGAAGVCVGSARRVRDVVEVASAALVRGRDRGRCVGTVLNRIGVVVVVIGVFMLVV